MNGQFITNKDIILSDVINSILPKCDNAYFLVGYFYFSGYTELCDKLKDIKLKILIGLDVERSIVNGIKEVENFVTNGKSRNQTKEEFYKSLVDLFNNTDFFDSEEQIEKFKLFLQKLEEGTLEIRKTSNPNHAKLYLFQNKEEDNVCGTFPGTMITGSSNLSVSGLKNRLELNVILRDKSDYEEGKLVFDELWEDSVPVADTDCISEFKNKVIKHIWYDKLYSPYLMYIRVLHEYFNTPTDNNLLTPYDITKGKFTNFKYQTDAVQLAINSIKTHEGVIVSDVVGLGKSIIASAVARNLKLRTIIICPPHLKEQWEDYKDDFDFTATVYTSGKLDDALEHYNKIVRQDEKFLIIVDEAHRYKNEFTRDYSTLHELCMGNKVVLLTATPYNNRPEDIYSMIKLFQIPNKSTLKTVANLGMAFKSLIAQYKELSNEQRKKSKSKDEIKQEADTIANYIRTIISPLVIRRSRLDLDEIEEYKEDLKKQNYEPVIPEDPIELTYSLKEIKDLYLETLKDISPTEEEIKSNPDILYYKGARYKPTAYIVDDENLRKELDKELEEKMGTDLGMLIGRQVNISDFMRRMLVRRYESSVAAFKESLNFMIDSSEHILKWIGKRNKVPVYKKGMLPDVDMFYQSNEDTEEEIIEEFEKYQERGFFEIDLKYIVKEKFINDINDDLKLLKNIRFKWFGEENIIKFDYKLESFRKQLKKLREEEPNRKIIVFTEFADTAEYLGQELKNDDLKVFKYTSKDASKKNKKIISANFDAGIEEYKQSDDYQVLIATDAISEGYNLHRAGTIFNYDIPYNPTRVVQRIGRINRINKKVFDKLYIYNYFPTEIGEGETRTKEISTLKMTMIHAILGGDTKVLTNDEELKAYFKKRYDEEVAKSEKLSWDTPYKVLYNSIKGTDVMSSALQIPHRSKIAREKDQYNGVIVLGKKGDDFVFKYAEKIEDKPQMLSPEQALKLFEASVDEEPFAVDKNFYKLYQHVKLNLFVNSTNDDKEKSRLEAKDKIKSWISMKLLPKDYLEDLLSMIMNDALSGEEVRFINRQSKATVNEIKERISQDYLNRIKRKMDKVDEGGETLIIAEQFK